MSVIDDIQWMEREISAMKSYSAPDLNVLVQKTYTRAPGPENWSSVSVRFTDNTRHMIWALPAGVHFIVLSTIRSDGLAIYRYLPKDGQPVTIVFSSFDDFQVVG